MKNHWRNRERVAGCKGGTGQSQFHTAKKLLQNDTVEVQYNVQYQSIGTPQVLGPRLSQIQRPAGDTHDH